MALKLLSAPALEPTTLSEAKAHLRVDSTDDDQLITSLITTARLQVEAALGLALISQQWRWSADCWPLNGIVELPIRPLQSVDAVRVLAPDETAATIDPITYAVDAAGNPPRLASRTGFWPTPGARLNGIEIDFTAGYGATQGDVPEDLRQAIHLLIAHWYEHRSVAGATAETPRIPATVSELLQPYQAVRL